MYTILERDTHCNMVARFAHCMAKHLLSSNPALFIGFPGCNNVEEVIAEKDRILHYTYHAALCHDIGKLLIFDTISMYGRRLLDDGFMMIKSHPVTGAKIAKVEQKGSFPLFCFLLKIDIVCDKI